MADEQSGGNLWMGAFAVVAIVVVGFLIYRQMQPSTPKIPEVNMSREEIMKGAMVDAPPVLAKDAGENKNLTTKIPGKSNASP
jgi:hypothetical protein